MSDQLLHDLAAIERDGHDYGGSSADVLLVACELPSRFTLGELAVALWRRDPQRWGLPGVEADHPSDHRVRAMLDGTRGLVARGKLRRNKGQYEVVL